MNVRPYRVGVDLGTTYTSAAVVRGDGRPEVVALGNRGTVIPSVVLVAERGRLIVGEAALRRAASEPNRVIREFKRRIGDPNKIERAGHGFFAEELMGELLNHVLEIVTEREGGPPSQLILTHPANWSAYKLDKLLTAFGPLRLPPMTTLTEPDAAALSYAQRQRVEPGGAVAVYDLGGGTFDAAILRRTQDSFEVIGRPTGIERLGGIDFDAAVMAHVNRYLDDALDNLDSADPLVNAGLARLRTDVVDAKEALSSEPDVTIPVYLPDLRTEVRLTRVEFEAMIRPSLTDTIGAVRRALASAELTADDLQAVLLVGGSSRIPLVAQLVGAELGRPVAVDAHPKHAVVLGAALSPMTGSGSVRAAAPLPISQHRDHSSAANAGGKPSPTATTPTPTVPAPPSVRPAATPVPPKPDAQPPEQRPAAQPTVQPPERRPSVQPSTQQPAAQQKAPARQTERPAAAAAPAGAATPTAPRTAPAAPKSTSATSASSPQTTRSAASVQPVAPVQPAFSAEGGEPPDRRLFWIVGTALFVAATVAGFIIFNQRDGGTGVTDQTSSTVEAAQTTTSIANTTTSGVPTSPAETVGGSTALPPGGPSLAVPAVPVDCTPVGSPYACIESLAVDANGNIIAEYDTTGFFPLIGSAPNRHVHFFFPVGPIAEDPQNAGTGTDNRGRWIAWDDPVFGPDGSVAGYSIDQANEVDATELCVLVANADHSVIVDTGNCVPLPAEALG